MEDSTNKYIKYKNKYIKEKNNYIKEENMHGGTSKTNLIYFGASWCGHCKAFSPVWDKIMSTKNSNVSYVKYDADLHKDMMKKYDIKGFPTLMLEDSSLKKNKLVEYVGNRSYEGIQEFITKYT